MVRNVLLALVLAASCAHADQAEADRLIQEGRRLQDNYEFDRGVELLDKAVEAAPDYWVAYHERAFAKLQALRPLAAIEDTLHAERLSPGNPAILVMRTMALVDMNNWEQAAENAAAALRQEPDYAQALALHGFALAHLGEIDAGISEIERANVLDADRFHKEFGAALMLRGDWDRVLKSTEQAIKADERAGSPRIHAVLALVELGRYDDAASAIAEAERLFPRSVGLLAMRGYLQSTPSAGKYCDAAAAAHSIRLALLDLPTPRVFFIQARALFMDGRYQECLDFITTRCSRNNFETLFWLGAAQWKLDLVAEARETLTAARRLNPYFHVHARRIPEMAEFAAAIELRLKGEAGGTAELRRELQTHLLSVSEIEALVRGYKFSLAVTEYQELLARLTSPVRKAEVEARLKEVRGMASAHKRLVAAIGKGTLKLDATVGLNQITITKATEAAFEFTLPKGTGKFPWAFLDPEIYVDFIRRTSPGPEELFGIGCLAWQADLRALAQRMFEEVSKKSPPLKNAMYAFLARQRGIEIPEGGFVLYQGRYVTPHEKKQMESGLVLFMGQWVTPADREKLSRGMVKIGDAWVQAEEKDLVKRGFRKTGDKWVGPEEYAAQRGAWSAAHVEETIHYTIKTNESEAFAKDLAGLVEAGYAEIAKHCGAEPKLPAGEKMTLYAFRTYEDYRKHCISVKGGEFLNAAGFARSDLNIVAGWNKTGDRLLFLQTMVHEAAHLFYFRVAPAAVPPSWYVEGMATFFEGFDWDGKAWKFDFISDSRLPFVRDAMKAGKHVNLADLLEGDALSLINQDPSAALLYYAECWALHFYLSHTTNKQYSSAWAAYRKAVASGGKEPLSKYIGNMGQLEKDWVAFILGL